VGRGRPAAGVDGCSGAATALSDSVARVEPRGAAWTRADATVDTASAAAQIEGMTAHASAGSTGDGTHATPATHGEAIRVVAAVISRVDALLVCQRPPHKRHGGLWEFPGGKCEPGESDADALRRELAEELSLELVRAGEPEAEFADPGSPFVIVFVPVEVRGEPVAHEHVALRWATPGALAAVPLAPSDRRFVEHRLAQHRAG
jgi:8-oxo-dGTP diphosphatase